MIGRCLCLWLAITASAYALAGPKADASIESIVTAGWWESSGESGSYRVIVWSAGYEHVSSGVVVEWLADPAEPGADTRIVHARELVAPGMFRIGEPKLTRFKKRVRIDLSGVNPHEPAQKISCRFEAFPDGEVKTIVPCH